jgi:SAM-dependent methyltransferase
VVRFAPLVRASGSVLDVACGEGRHSRLFLERGHDVVAIDIDISQMGEHSRLKLIEADLEKDNWPLPGAQFDAVVVTNFLHRPLLDRLVDSVAFGGVLLYETFARGNERFGRPSNPDYLLHPGELLDLARPSLRVVAYEDVTVTEPRPAALQRICAVRQ